MNDFLMSNCLFVVCWISLKISSSSFSSFSCFRRRRRCRRRRVHCTDVGGSNFYNVLQILTILSWCPKNSQYDCDWMSWVTMDGIVYLKKINSHRQWQQKKNIHPIFVLILEKTTSRAYAYVHIFANSFIVGILHRKRQYIRSMYSECKHQQNGIGAKWHTECTKMYASVDANFKANLNANSYKCKCKHNLSIHKTHTLDLHLQGARSVQGNVCSFSHECFILWKLQLSRAFVYWIMNCDERMHKTDTG